jgi:hypothetical protein
VPLAAQEPDTLQERVDEIMAEYARPDTPGAVVAFVRGGQVEFQSTYGMADLTHGIPFEVDTPTNIGSTSKQFTAFALAIGGWRLEDHDHIDRREILAVVQRQPELQNSPGAEWNYNNTGYALDTGYAPAALAVERVTGEPFPNWMASHVFEPLGIGDTRVPADPRTIISRATRGYVPHPEVDAGVLVLSNHGGFSGTVPGRITQVFLGAHMEPPEEAPSEEEADSFEPEGYEAASFDPYAGRYELEAVPGFILTFWREADRLRTQATRQSPADLRPTSDSTFVLVGVDTGITFHRDDTGAVTGLTLHQARTHADGDVFSGTFPVLRVVFERDEDGRVTGSRASNGRTRDTLFERMG